MTGHFLFDVMNGNNLYCFNEMFFFMLYDICQKVIFDIVYQFKPFA